MGKGKYENYVGKKFATLTVLEEFKKETHHQIFCKVKCECGREFELLKKSVKWRNDNHINCNCNKTDNLDVINKTFGQLTVISFSRYKNKRKMFLCKCSCGNEVERNKTQLRDGVQVCNDVSKHNETYHNIIGKRFDKLLVLEEVSKTASSQRQYKCICDCGKEKIILGSNLIYGESTSCGCNREYVEGTKINLLVREEAYPNSKSGIKGIWQDKKGYWHGHITVQGKRIPFYGGPGEEGKAKAIKWREQMVEQYHKPLIEKYKGKIS